jgi:hypothetical protein
MKQLKNGYLFIFSVTILLMILRVWQFSQVLDWLIGGLTAYMVNAIPKIKNE